MSEDAAIQNVPRPRPMSIGLFWFAALVTATGLWTGVVSSGSLPDIPRSVSNPAEPPAAGESGTLLPQPFRSTLPGNGGVVANTIPTWHIEEQLGASESIPGGSVAGSGFVREAREPESGPRERDQRNPELTLSLNVPDSAAVDEPVMVWVNLKNGTDTAAEAITVTCRFDEHFEFPGSRDGAVRQRLGSLAPGDSRGLALPLTTRRIGRGRLDLLVSSDTHADTTSERSLEIRGAQSAAVNVGIVGPRRRTVGSRAEYVITVVNDTGSDLPSATVQISHEPSLRLKEVSEGAERRPGILHWDLGTLFDNERIQIQVEFECASAVSSTRLTAEVTANGRSIGAAEDRLAVVPRPDLELRIRDLVDPLEPGQRSTFLLELENHAPETARDIVVRLVPSRNIEITAARVRRESGELSLKAFVEGNSLLFQPAPQLEPGAGMTCEIDFNARSAGVGELRALLQSRTLAIPLEVSEPLVINPPLTGG